MTMPTIGRNKILALGLIVVAVAGYYIFTSSKDAPEPLTTVETNNADSISQQLIIELNRLKGLRSIDDSIFRDPVFVSLQDYTQAVVPQPLGRTNPFAPIGAN
jgi:hypothetical protein